MNIAVITDGYIDWNGGLDFLKIILRGLEGKPCRVFLFFISENERRFHHIPIWMKRTIELILPYRHNSAIKLFAEFEKFEIVDYSMTNLNSKLKEKEIDVIFPTMVDLGPNVPVKWCLELFDCQHKYFPHYFSYIRRVYRDYFYRRAIRNSDMVFVNSLTAQKDFVKFYQADVDKIKILPFCPTLNKKLIGEDNLEILKKYSINIPFFLISNQFWMHKAHDVAFKALSVVKKKGYKNVGIVCTGFMADYRGNKHIEYLVRLIDELKLNSQIKLLGFIPKKDQIELMKQSLGVIQPSQYEGDCSGQVIDAIAIGQRSIVSDIDVCKEISFINTVRYFKLNDEKDLAEKMIEFINIPYTRPAYDSLIEQEEKYKIHFSDYLFKLIEELRS